jgi:hypothetical protein
VQAIEWAQQRAMSAGAAVTLQCCSIFDATLAEGGSGYTDQQVYERASLGGGLGYSEDHLRALWDKAPFRVRELRQMRRTDGQGSCFGQDFLWVLLAAKESSA